MFWAKQQLVSCFWIINFALSQLIQSLFNINIASKLTLLNKFLIIKLWIVRRNLRPGQNKAIAWTNSSKKALDLMYQLKSKMWLLVIILDDPFENFQFSLCERKSDLDYTFRLICQEKTDLADQDRFGPGD